MRFFVGRCQANGVVSVGYLLGGWLQEKMGLAPNGFLALMLNNDTLRSCSGFPLGR